MLTHGGDWQGYREHYGADALDFSANISPLGLPKGIREAAIKALSHADRYPDPLCRELRRAIAQKEGVRFENICCGNGAADLIFRLTSCRRPRRALVTAPTFAEYEQALSEGGCRVEYYTLSPEKGFMAGEDILERIVPGLDMLFLCEPNNPTGAFTPKPLLLRIVRRCAETGTLLVVDECFADLTEYPASHTLKGELERFPGLLLLKAFTKLYAMAGLRLGYALCGDAALTAALQETGQPWAVSSVAQAAGVAALREDAYAERVRRLTASQRPLLQEGLSRLGMLVFPGSANYILFYSPFPQLGKQLAAAGVLIRDCSNYRGLGAGWYRTAVRTPEENRRLLEEMERVLEGRA